MARQLSQQGMEALHRGRFKEAEANFQRAIEHCPSHTNSRYQLANCLWKRGARREAIAQLEEAVQLAGSEDVQMLVELGYMQANVGHFDLALQRAEEAIRLSPDCPHAWQLHGDILQEQREWEPALASYQRALAHDPSNLEVHLATAEVYQKLKRPNRVLATVNFLERQIAEPHRPEGMLVLKSMALQQLDRYDEAVDVLVAASQRQPLSVAGLTQLANAQIAAGHDGDAQQTIQHALRSAGPNQQASLRRLMERLAHRDDQDAQPRRR